MIFRRGQQETLAMERQKTLSEGQGVMNLVLVIYLIFVFFLSGTMQCKSVLQEILSEYEKQKFRG